MRPNHGLGVMALAASVWLIGCDALGGVPRPADDPAPRIPDRGDEPFDVVADGTSSGLGWRLLSHAGPQGLACLQVDIAGSGSADCNAPQFGSAIWLLTWGADLTHGDERYEAVYGLTSPEVARLEVHFADGRVEALDGTRTEIEGREAIAFVLIHLEDDRALRVVAYDASGAVLEQRGVRQAPDAAP